MRDLILLETMLVLAGRIDPAKPMLVLAGRIDPAKPMNEVSHEDMFKALDPMPEIPIDDRPRRNKSDRKRDKRSRWT